MLNIYYFICWSCFLVLSMAKAMIKFVCAIFSTLYFALYRWKNLFIFILSIRMESKIHSHIHLPLIVCFFYSSCKSPNCLNSQCPIKCLLIKWKIFPVSMWILLMQGNEYTFIPSHIFIIFFFLFNLNAFVFLSTFNILQIDYLCFTFFLFGSVVCQKSQTSIIILV